MAKIKLSDILKDIYYGTIGSLPHLFWKGSYTSVGLMDQLNKAGVTSPELNAYMSKNIEGKVRQFPEALDNRKIEKAVDRALFDFYDPTLKNLPYKDKKERLMFLIAMDVADNYRVQFRVPDSLR